MRYLCLLGLSLAMFAVSHGGQPTAKPPKNNGAKSLVKGEVAKPAVGEAITELTSAVKKRLLASCFEVVIPRPEKDSLTYEKELPWEQVPFHIRNDKYFSIGTAFAVSATELITAFHVLDLTQELLSYPRYYIRDAEQRVYEVDQILLAHEHRDIVRFTVKGRTFEQWLELEPTFEMNRPVFTAGNAYGEGIVVRRGELIGTLPEALDGAWSWLKSSADVNAGNSGGPLLNPQGRVIGVVTQRKDNLSYSLPTAEIAKLKPSTAAYFNKVAYSFNLFPEKSKLLTSAFEYPLPMGYRELRSKAFQKRQGTYEHDMEALFAEQKELFPKGASSLDVIYDTPTSSFPEVVYKDTNSGRWAITDVKTNSFDLGNNGRLVTASTCGVVLMQIKRPDTVSYVDLVEKPRVAIDLVFKGLNVPREMGGEKIRITSLGEPMRTLEHKDRYGRPWRLDIWHMEFSDQVLLMYSTPTPTGLLGVLMQTGSAKIETWTYDLRKILDFLYVPYTARLKDWGPYLALRSERHPDAFKELRFTFEAGKSLQLRSPWISMDLDGRTHALAPNDTLGLYLGFTKAGSAAPWDLRRLAYSEDEGDNYFVWINNPKPEEGMADGFQKSWREIAQKRHPHTRTAFAKDGRTDIAMTLGAFLPKNAAPESAPSLYTLYMGRTGTLSDSTMKKLLDTTAAGIKPAVAP
ncbi:MAG: serine protease [Holophaga sp.]|nr:serine protease [Holophaga sp.]